MAVGDTAAYLYENVGLEANGATVQAAYLYENVGLETYTTNVQAAHLYENVGLETYGSNLQGAYLYENVQGVDASFTVRGIQTVIVDASSSIYASGATFVYNFGDGSTPVSTTATSASHTYPAVTATYTITVTITNTTGASGSASVSHTVPVYDPIIAHKKSHVWCRRYYASHLDTYTMTIWTGTIASPTLLGTFPQDGTLMDLGAWSAGTEFFVKMVDAGPSTTTTIWSYAVDNCQVSKPAYDLSAAIASYPQIAPVHESYMALFDDSNTANQDFDFNDIEIQFFMTQVEDMTIVSADGNVMFHPRPTGPIG